MIMKAMQYGLALGYGHIEMNWKSTKFLQTSFVLIATVSLVAFGAIDGTAYVTITAVALGNYAYHDVKQKEVK